MAVRQAENHRFDQSLLRRSRDLGHREDIWDGFGEMPCRFLQLPHPR